MNFNNDFEEFEEFDEFDENDENTLDIDDLNEEQLFELLDSINYLDKTEREQNSDTNLSAKNCSECGTSDHIVEDKEHGINVCTKCGNVITEIFDETGEWKYCEGGNDNARCSGITNHFLPQSSLGTTIAGANFSKVKMLHNWNAMPYKERQLNNILKEIQNACREGGILKCIEDDAKILYKKISESNYILGKHKGKPVLTRGKNSKALIASCIFYACKRAGKTRSPKEIGKLFKISSRSVTRGCKIFKNIVELTYLQNENKISNSEDFILRYCRSLHIQNHMIDEAIQVSKNIRKLNITSMHTPVTVAISSILVIIQKNNLNIDKKTLAQHFEISEVTINHTYKKINQYMQIILNTELTNVIFELMEKERMNTEIVDSLKNFDDIHDIDAYINNVDSKFKNRINEVDNEYKQIMQQML